MKTITPFYWHRHSSKERTLVPAGTPLLSCHQDDDGLRQTREARSRERTNGQQYNLWGSRIWLPDAMVDRTTQGATT